MSEWISFLFFRTATTERVATLTPSPAKDSVTRDPTESTGAQSTEAAPKASAIATQTGAAARPELDISTETPLGLTGQPQDQPCTTLSPCQPVPPCLIDRTIGELFAKFYKSKKCVLTTFYLLNLTNGTINSCICLMQAGDVSAPPSSQRLVPVQL